MNPVLPPLAQRTVQRLIRAFAPEQVVLFGSYAKGTTHPGSDVDLLVITHVGGDVTSYQQRARQLASDAFPPLDFVFATPEEVANAASAPNKFLQSVLETGTVIYRREL
jgi:predicted nucleotidyltransferase